MITQVNEWSTFHDTRQCTSEKNYENEVEWAAEAEVKKAERLAADGARNGILWPFPGFKKGWCKILRISYKDNVTNQEVRANIQQATGPHEDLLTIVKRRKLKWYGHVSRSSGLGTDILQGTVKKGRRQGRQRKRWKDNIREWTDLEFAKC